MRSKSKIPKHFAKQDGGGGRRTRRVAMMATILVAIIAVLLAVSPGFGTQLPSVGRPEGQDLSLGFVRVQTKPGITVADTVDQLSAAGVRSQPNYSYSVGEGGGRGPRRPGRCDRVDGSVGRRALRRGGRGWRGSRPVRHRRACRRNRPFGGGGSRGRRQCGRDRGGPRGDELV